MRASVGSNMKVTYTNTPEDWAATLAHDLEVWQAFHDAVFVWRWALAAGAAVLVVAAVPHPSISVRLGWAAVVAIAIYWWYPRYAKKRYLQSGMARMNAKENLSFLTGERSVEVSVEGLRVQSPAGDSLVRWGYVKAIDEGPRHVFVRFRLGVGLAIPNSALSSEERAMLVAELRAHVGSGAG